MALANKLGFPLVATSDAHYLHPGDAEAHDILLCINTGAKFTDAHRMRYGNEATNGHGRVERVDEFYVCGPEKMYDRFKGLEEAVRRTQEIADAVDIQLDFKARHFPVFQTPAAILPGGALKAPTPEEYLREVCEQGMRERYPQGAPPGRRERLEYELGVVCRMGFAPYFLVVWDFVRFARERGIPCGARGSAAGAIISYLLYLSHIDPIEYELLFERFLDPNRAEAPDIDMDFCEERRQEVIEYVKQKYGDECVAQIATFGTLAARAALKDVARALDIPLDETNRITKLVPEKVGTTIRDGLAKVPELKQLYESSVGTRRWFDLAMTLEGTNRQAGTHAAGVARPRRETVVFVQRLISSTSAPEVGVDRRLGGDPCRGARAHTVTGEQRQ